MAQRPKVTIPAKLPKRGHNKDFALSESQVHAVIEHVSSYTTKAVLILASRGYTVKEITQFKYGRQLIGKSDRAPILSTHLDVLRHYPDGLGISGVAVWRRTKKALIEAAEAKVINLDPEKIPFPEALRFTKKEPSITRHRVEGLARRMHYLNGGFGDYRDPLKDCPHVDCIEVRELLSIIDREQAERA